MARRTADQTRQLLLDTGVEMLYEQGISSPVGHIRLQNVLRRAGLTTGAAYRIWAGQEDFQRDLAEEATRRRPEDGNPVGPLMAAIGDALAAGAPMEEVIRLATNANIGTYAQLTGGGLLSDHFRTVLALRTAALGSEQLRSASLERHEESVDSFAEMYAALAGIYGLRVRTPYTVRDFSGVLAALSEGFALQSIQGAQPRTITVTDPDGTEREWTAYGRAVAACVAEFFEPDPATGG